MRICLYTLGKDLSFRTVLKKASLFQHRDTKQICFAEIRPAIIDCGEGQGKDRSIQLTKHLKV
jgi:hypothetical protein